MASLTFSFPFVCTFSPSGTSLLHGVMWGSSLLLPRGVSHIPALRPPSCGRPVTPCVPKASLLLHWHNAGLSFLLFVVTMAFWFVFLLGE